METTTPKLSFSELSHKFLMLKNESKDLPILPIEPGIKSAYTISEWNQYIKDIKEYIDRREKTEKKLSQHKKEFKDTEELLRNMLPAANIWFISDDKSIAVAKQSHDWPGAEADILIKENPNISELPILKERKYSYN